MPGSSVPWLADLPDEWPQEQPTATLPKYSTTSASSRAPVSSPKRSPLSDVKSSRQNTLLAFDTLPTTVRNGTVDSVDSVVRYDTVERQPSPAKKAAEMTWKKRLVDGDLGYGDQTDLFGPSALENMFSPSKQPSSTTRTSREESYFNDMPSSPPQWPPTMFKTTQQVQDLFATPTEEIDAHVWAGEAREADLDDAQEVAEPLENEDMSQLQSSGGFGDAQDGMVGDARVVSSATAIRDPPKPASRAFSGLSDMGITDGETFSPVYISKHTTLTGEIGYKPVDGELVRQLHQSSASQESVHVASPTVDASAPDADQSHNGQTEDSTFHDESIPQIEVSLPDNLPTGTPPVTRLGGFVTMHRGGLSEFGSFKQRPLSPSSRKTSCTMPLKPSTLRDEAKQVEIILLEEQDIYAEEAEPVRREPATPEKQATMDAPSRHTPRSSRSPFKLFGTYDTYTNKRLMRRLSQLEGFDAGDKIVSDAQEECFSPQAQEDMDDENPSSLEPSVVDDAVNTDDHDAAELQAHLDRFGENESDELNYETNISFPLEASGNELPCEAGLDSREGSPDPDAMPPGARSPFMFHLDESEQVQEVSGIKRKLSDRSTNRSNRPLTSESSPQIERSSTFAAKRQRTLNKLETDLASISLLQRRPSIADSEIDDGTAGNDLSHIYTTESIRWYDDRDRAPSKLQAIREKIEDSSLPGSIKLVSQAKAVASEMAAFTLNVTKHDGDGTDRKRSITTQDFLDEAMHIMSLIRARGRPQSGLDSVEESNEEQSIMEQPPRPHFERSSSVLRVSRPPSREGAGNGWRPTRDTQGDSQIVKQLEKFQERDDLDIIDSTLRSLRLNAHAHDQYSEMSDGSQAYIRRADSSEQASDDDLDADHGHNLHEIDIGTVDSEGYSTGRTQGTSSTHKSDNVATLAPETVAHLIPQEVGGMTFDNVQNRWVRNKQERRRPSSRLTPYAASNITSDDDVFGNIPDLTVDEVQEHCRTRSRHDLTGRAEDQTAVFTMHARTQSLHDESTFEKLRSDFSKADDRLRSSVIPGASHLAASQGVTETRATSWASEKQIDKHGHSTSSKRKMQRELSDPFDLVRHLETSTRVVQQPETIPELVTFSTDCPNPEDNRRDAQVSDIEELPVRNFGTKHKRKVSFQTTSYMPRRFAQDVEQSEMSIIAELPDKRVMSVSVAVSRPSPHDQLLTPRKDQIEQSALILSDLPDFTIAEIERQAGKTERGLAAVIAQHGHEVQNDRYALAVQTLVKALTDVKGDEPFWEDLKHLSLQGHGLDTVVGLQEFCTSLQRLDVARNLLAHLDGIPHHVRWLDASHNALTNLSAWHNLMHLQYLDISHNQLVSLDGLGCLYHLRELKATDNQITSIDGLRDLDGLQRLDVSGNSILDVDLANAAWAHLQDLDLSGNLLSSIALPSELEHLKTLRIDHNAITTISFSGQALRIETLSASHNDLSSFDVTWARHLRSLDLDGNKLSSITGLASLSQLDTLSIRAQTASDPATLWSSTFARPLSARTVLFSGTPLPNPLTLASTQPSISHLDLSTCGLTVLPADFARHFPSLRSVSLNFNGLKDIRPLLNLPHLTRLSLIGNRLARLRKCVETLAHLKALREVDLRDNPFTLGFSAPTPHAESSVELVPCAKGAGAGTDAPFPGAQQAFSTYALRRQRTDSTYILPTVAAAQDAAHRTSLDKDTILRRRVYEILVASSCAGIAILDGRGASRREMLGRDEAWERLVELGVLKKRHGE